MNGKKFSAVILVIVLCLIIFASTAAAEDFYHSVEVKLDGAWKLDSTVQGQTTQSAISLEGEGKAEIRAVTKTANIHSWWDLF